MAQIVHLTQRLPARYALGVALLAVMLTFSYEEDVLFDCMLSLRLFEPSMSFDFSTGGVVWMQFLHSKN